MLGARRLDHFAVGAKFRAWQLLEKLIELHRFFVFLEQTLFAFLRSLVALDVAWLRAQAEVPCHEELDADEARRDHEVVDVEDGLDHDELSNQHIPEQDGKNDRRPVVP